VVGESDWVPLVPLLPDQAPDAVHDVALDADHVSTDDPPEVMDEGEADRVTVGTGGVMVTD